MAGESHSRGYEARVISSPEDNGLLVVCVGKFPEREMVTQATSVFRVNE